ncbi:Hypothetical predicted protein, partial [Paramuricea clavata]
MEPLERREAIGHICYIFTLRDWHTCSSILPAHHEPVGFHVGVVQMRCPDKVTINIAQRSGRLVSWLGILSVGEDPPCDDGTNKTLWSYGSGENVVPLRPGYDARLNINSERTSFEISCKVVSSRSHNFGPIFQCAVISGEDNLYTTQEVKPTTAEQQTKLFAHLKREDPQLYGKLDPCKRTLFLGETGDNFRAGAHQPTEQMSFSILNLTKLINSPYGQFLISIWRGPETRNYIQAHVKGHYDDVRSAVHNGLALTLADDTMETFNIIAFLVTDLGHLKESL